MKLCMGCMENIEDNVTTCPHCGYDETTLRHESYYLDPGTVVGGKYIVGKVISYGGYTITYLGMDAENNQKVMVKEYLPSDFSTRSDGETEVTIYSGDALEQFEQGLTTFLNEANRIQHLNNVQGIAKVYDCVAENDTGYVISEYVEGQTLKEILDAGKIFTPQEAKVFICQILEGLRQVHPLDIIHCDISPETIMLTNTGEIKLMDFGATRYVTTANSKSLAIILKQGYAPEEQYRSRGVRGPWTDVYALGAVMYRMITGKVPTESVDRALQDELKEPSQLGIAIPQNLENALMNALNVYQSDRTPSAEVFLRELNSPEVRRIQVKKRKNDTGKFPKWAKGLVAGLLCVILAGGIYMAFNVTTSDKSANNNTGKEPKLEPAKLKGELDSVKKYWENTFGLNWKDDLKIIYEYDSNAEEEMVDDIREGKEEVLQEGNTAINSVSWLVPGKGRRELKKLENNRQLNGILYVKSAKQFSFRADWLSFYPKEEEAVGMKLVRDSDTSQPYGKIKTIKYRDKTYDVNNKLDKEKLLNLLSIKVGETLQFNIYTGEYYKCNGEITRKIKEGKNINNFKKFEVWKDKKLKEECPKNITAEDYYSFDHESGYIVEIDNSFKQGKDFDQSKIKASKVFYTVKQKFEKNHMTVRKLKRQLPNLQIKDKAQTDGSPIEEYKYDYIITGCDDEYFEANDEVTLTLKAPATPKPEPVETAASTTKPTQAKPDRQPDSADADGFVSIGGKK